MSQVSRNSNLKIVYGVTLMAVMGVASITPAFPAMMEQFHLKPQDVAILITAFTLPAIFLTPVIGILADRLGRKRILVPSLILFGLAGAAITLTRNFQTIVLLRALQGVGATALGSLNVTLIGDLFEPRQRPEAMGYNASVLSLGVAAYPAIGGVLAGVTWYAPFYLPLLAIGVALLVLFKLRLPPIRKIQNNRQYFKNAWKNIHQPGVWGLFIINVLMFVILYGALLSYFPILLRQRFNAPEWQIGLYMSIFSVATAIVSSQNRRLSAMMSVRVQLVLSLVAYAAGQVGIGMVHHAWWILLPVVLFGAGHGMLFPAVQTLLVGMAPMQERAVFMSINSMVLRVGQTVGPMAMAAVFVFGGLTWVYWTGAAISLVMMVVWIMTPVIRPPE
ncbi:MAG: MFS transporter [Deltaproteobacteria bacterium]|nr:MFS transporter [Deltaproteobacteria bacterium]